MIAHHAAELGRRMVSPARLGLALEEHSLAGVGVDPPPVAGLVGALDAVQLSRLVAHLPSLDPTVSPT